MHRAAMLMPDSTAHGMHCGYAKMNFARKPLSQPRRESILRRTIMSELISDPRRTAVVVIDLQKGVVAFPGNPHATESVIVNAVALLEAARSAGAQPILVHVGRSPDGGDGLKVTSDQPMRAAGAMPPDWSDLIPELDRQPNDIVILKRQWGAFYGTDLELQLRRRGLNTIILCGIATAIGVESTARDAYERGFEQLFAEDAMTCRTVESHSNSITNIFSRMGRVRSTAEIIKALSAGKSAS
jgi:nicotinamidase-related amidase